MIHHYHFLPLENNYAPYKQEHWNICLNTLPQNGNLIKIPPAHFSIVYFNIQPTRPFWQIRLELVTFFVSKYFLTKTFVFWTDSSWSYKNLLAIFFVFWHKIFFADVFGWLVLVFAMTCLNNVFVKRGVIISLFVFFFETVAAVTNVVII